MGIEKQMLRDELRVNEALNKQQANQVEKLKEELREVKQIIKVPRLHFKYLEKLEYEGLLKQRRELESGYETGGAKTQAIANTNSIEMMVKRRQTNGTATRIEDQMINQMSNTLTEGLESINQFI